MEKISIITICYNCKNDLRMTIESVIFQNYSHYEYIVIDGGSTDGTLDIIHEYQDHIDINISEHDEGIYDAINKGILHATGEWILCLNAGDRLFDKNTLSNIFTRQGLYPYHVIYSDCIIERKDGTTFRAIMDRKKGVIHHQNVIYRKALHLQYGMYHVTKPYIVSDLIFLLSINENSFLKIETPIAISKDGGISCALWSGEQAIGLRIAYGLEHMPIGFINYIKLRINVWLHNILRNKRWGIYE